MLLFVRGHVQIDPMHLDLLHCKHRPKIQRIHHVGQKPRQMLFRKPIMQRWRQQQCLVQIVVTRILSRKQHLKTDSPAGKPAPSVIH